MTAPVVMWFRQDLRLADNAALAAAASAGPIVCLYVLDDETPGRWRWGGASRWWLHRSLEMLAQRIPIVLRRGVADRVIAGLLQETGAKAVYFARDYAPWGAALEARVRDACAKASAACHRYGGFLLHEPEAIRTATGAPYKVYTPFARACLATAAPRAPRPAPSKMALWPDPVEGDRLKDWNLLPKKPNWAAGFPQVWQPGEDGARRRLSEFIADALLHYADERDYPARAAISRLSPHLHWGEISPIQCWHAVRTAVEQAGGRLDGAGEKFLKELLWREFSTHLIHQSPELPERSFRPEFENFPWRSDPASLRAWQQGRTGYPLVDAGMRELWATGFMHNRVRMIAASFLIKHLLVSWQEGEAWFWDTLVDADIANNAASWQWVAGSGADAAPYFRIFNPLLQAVKFDPQGDYVKRWVQELAALPARHVLRPWDAPGPVSYPKPIVDHDFARSRALQAFAEIKGANA